MKNKRAVTERVFKCPCCGVIMTAYKKSSRKTKEGHLKKLWCYKCKRERNFEQVRYY